MSNERRTIGSLRELPREIAPPRDLWAGIAAQLDPASPESASTDGASSVRASPVRRWNATSWRALSAAAVVTALAIGMWIGHWVLPSSVSAPGSIPGTSAGPGTRDTGTLPAAYVMDPRYTGDREALLQSVQAQVAALPPESRAKVLSSLQTIQQSITDLRAALGRDPSNALLQELLVNTYQDEMRVLTTVHEAESQGKGI